MAHHTKQFVMKDYGKKSTFASFLPGISGTHGTPIWCYYVNRGQGVVSFGVDNKDSAIMEFFPAHQAYQAVKTTGFRTFIKKDGAVYEPFSEEKISHSMSIAMNGFSIEETNESTGIQTSVEYFTLPGERVGALVRKVTIKNISDAQMSLEVLDGMPAVIPYGVGMEDIKNMGQTVKAWMQVEDVESNVPYYRVRASIKDSAEVKSILGGNFSMACLEDGTQLKPIVDPEVVFAYDNSLRKAVSFEEKSLTELYKAEQITANQVPCSFYGTEKVLAKGEAFSIYELIGQVSGKEVLAGFVAEKKDGKYFEAKKAEAEKYVEEVVAGITTKTASEDFDAYCQYTYMDNVLRGGYPIQLGNNKIFYVYSRKHGDLERDYNYFSMLPEFYSQGNGNFRDVNQNRRCDTFFAPFVGRENIKMFYSLIQLDGYNPLGIEKLTYKLTEEKATQIAKATDLTEEKQKALVAFVTKAFTPGALYHELDVLGLGDKAEAIFQNIIDFADSMVNGNFGEGYWSDHWTYNLDLIQDYLEVFPEQEEEMLFEKDYSCFLSQVNINPREARCEETANGLRQYHALDEANKRNTAEKLVRDNYGQGEIYKMTLLSKLILLCTTKFAALDAYGMGVEMEGGKPGWYDALNGMPAMFGSSMSESYELCRMLEYTIDVLKKYEQGTFLPEELAVLVRELAEINKAQSANVHALDAKMDAESIRANGQVLAFWNEINDAKEAYREKVFAGISGKETELSAQELAGILEGFLDTVQTGIAKATVLGDGISPTYFTYDVTEYEKTEKGYKALAFKVNNVPYFLEGAVRYLKIKNTPEKKKELYDRVKNSDLYDEKLNMYKVNASLLNESYELGRARVFTPGWLENESIWLHMEYKYLLELLRSGMYSEYFEDFHKAAVPFLDEEIYGRSIFENSSFIASSKNPNKSFHGKGFVARLSGSTIEFISMWKLMMFGSKVLTVKDGELTFAPAPAMPAYLIPENGEVSATLFGKTEVTYHFDKVVDYMPGNYCITSMKFDYDNGNEVVVNAAFAGEKIAKDVRSGAIAKITVEVSHE